MAIDPHALEMQFERLTALDDASRAQALAALAATDAAMAARVAALLDAAAMSGEAVPTGLASRIAAFAVEDLAGRRIGGWILTRLLGRGGMGVVYAAEREFEGIRQKAAIKLLSMPLFDAAASERFAREAAALARLDHPGIARLRSFGRSEEGWPFLVLDLVEGEAIDVLADRLAPSDRLELMLQVADAVGAAHRQLVLHLDLKPENILVDHAGRVRLLDFGVSRILSEDAEASATVTRWLTPDYASPEQLRGERATVSADVYALGVLLYRLASGERPHRLSGLSITAALRRLEAGAPPPSRQSRGLPRDLDAVVACAMHTDPARRYPGAEAFAADLRAVLERRPIKARPDSVAYRTRKLFERHPVAMPGVLLGVAVLVSMSLALALQAQDLLQQRDRAQREAARASAATGYLLDSLDAIDPKTRSETGIGLVALLDATEDRLRAESTDDPRLVADVEVQIGRLRVSLGQNEAGLTAFDRALAALEAQAPDIDAPRMSMVQSHRTGALRALARLDEALAAGEQAIAWAGDDRAARLFAHRRKAQVLERLGRFDEADALAEASLLLVDADDVITRAGLFNDLAASALARTDFPVAERNARMAYDLYRQAYDEPHLDTTEAAWRLAAAMLNQGRADEAEPLLQEAVDVRTALYGPEDHRVGEVLIVLSNAQGLLGKPEAALASALRGEAIYFAALDPDNPRLMMAVGAAGNMLRDVGQLDEAIERFERGWRLAESIYGDAPHPVTAFFMQAVASIEVHRERYAQARDLYRRTIDMMVASGSADGVNMMLARHSLARSLRGLDELDDALREAELAYALGRASLPEDAWELATVRSELGLILLLSGRGAEGEAHLTRAEAILGPDDSVAVHDNRVAHTEAMLALYERLGDREAEARMRGRLARLRQGTEALLPD